MGESWLSFGEWRFVSAALHLGLQAHSRRDTWLWTGLRPACSDRRTSSCRQTEHNQRTARPIGFAPEFGYVDAGVFNGRGHPVHIRGVTRHSGLYFLGLPWLYTWGSGRFSGIARDAEYLVGQIAAHQRQAAVG